jgi:hypothetical protein
MDFYLVITEFIEIKHLTAPVFQTRLQKAFKSKGLLKTKSPDLRPGF